MSTNLVLNISLYLSLLCCDGWWNKKPGKYRIQVWKFSPFLPPKWFFIQKTLAASCREISICFFKQISSWTTKQVIHGLYVPRRQLAILGFFLIQSLICSRASSLVCFVSRSSLRATSCVSWGNLHSYLSGPYTHCGILLYCKTWNSQLVMSSLLRFQRIPKYLSLNY